MQMQMENDLAGVGPVVNDQSIAAVLDTLVYRDLTCKREHAADKRLVLGLELPYRVDMSVGDDENMGGRDRLNVAEGGERIILKEDFGSDVTCRNPTKNTFW